MTTTNDEEYQEIVRNLSDAWWRITSGKIYKIIIKGDDDDDEGLVIPFKPNRAQRRLLKKLWNRNVILHDFNRNPLAGHGAIQQGPDPMRDYRPGQGSS
jgi:hypothetical protein